MYAISPRRVPELRNKSLVWRQVACSATRQQNSSITYPCICNHKFTIGPMFRNKWLLGILLCDFPDGIVHCISKNDVDGATELDTPEPFCYFISLIPIFKMDKVHAYFTHLPQYGQTATVILAACLTIIYSSLFQTNAGEAQYVLFSLLILNFKSTNYFRFFVLLCDKYLDFQKKSNTSDKVHVEMLDQISILRNQTFQQLTDQSVSTGVAFGITFLACFLSAGGGLQLLKVYTSLCERPRLIFF